jgi:hypothetical protein
MTAATRTKTTAFQTSISPSRSTNISILTFLKKKHICKSSKNKEKSSKNRKIVDFPFLSFCIFLFFSDFGAGGHDSDDEDEDDDLPDLDEPVKIDDEGTKGGAEGVETPATDGAEIAA